MEINEENTFDMQRATIMEAYERMDKIIKDSIFPIFETWNIEKSHCNYVKDMIQQLYDMLNAALCDQENDRYRIRYEGGLLTVEDGFVGSSIEPERYIRFYISGRASPFMDVSNISKVSSPFLRRRIRNAYPSLTISKSVTKRWANFYEFFEQQRHEDEELNFTPILISFKAKRVFYGEKEGVFEYRKGLPFFDNCAFKEYI